MTPPSYSYSIFSRAYLLRLCTPEPQKKVDKKGVGLLRGTQFWSRDLPLFAYRREKGIPAGAGVADTQWALMTMTNG